MGDLKTHARIYRNLRKTLDGSFFNEEPFDNLPFYFELGNFFTDVSQFHDPPALDKKKVEIMAEKSQLGPYLSSQAFGKVTKAVGIVDYLNKLFGEQDKNQPGYFIDFINQLLFGLKFRSFSHEKVSYQEYAPLAKRYWEKYWHHEHLDAPPCSSQIAPYLSPESQKKMFRYLEMGMKSQAELLERLEMDVLINELQVENPEEKRKGRQEALVRMGRYSHAIEDFFFHSNFVEWVKWEEIKHQFTLKYPWFIRTRFERIMDSPEFRDFFKSAEITSLKREGEDDTGYPILSEFAWSLRDKRKFIRRLLPFASECKPVLSRDKDDVYTGGFGEYDILHTFHDALEGIEELFEGFREMYFLVGRRFGLDATKVLEPLDHIFIEAKRKRLLIGENEHPILVPRLMKIHKENISEGNYIRFLKHAEELIVQLRYSPKMRRQLGITDEKFQKINFPFHSFRAFHTAFRLDEALFEDFSAIDMGVYGPLLTLATQLQLAENNSSLSQLKLDVRQEIFGSYQDRLPHDFSPSDEDLPLKEIGENGASIENPFTHSLLNKDSKRKTLLREEALTLAFFTSEFLVRTLIDNVSLNLINFQEGAPVRVIDWEKTLAQFIVHPNEAPEQWHLKVLKYSNVRPEMTGVKPFYKYVDLENMNSLAVTREMRNDYIRSWKIEHENWKNIQKSPNPAYSSPY